jgi:ParB family transcriptional regulator, chromosome partitioning protein
MTTSAAANTTGKAGEKEKDKEKTGIRRALGRGLESLLPGPRAVPRAPSVPAPGQSGAAAGTQQVPHSVRNDKGEALDGVIQAVAETAVADDAEPRSVGQPATTPPHHSNTWRDGDPGAVPTRSPTHSIPHSAVAATDSISIMAQAEGRVPGNLVIQLALTDIDKNPFQTRYVHKDDALEELADSIKANGVVQPIVVRPAAEDGRYVLVLGERRLHASKLAGRETIPAIVRRVSEQQAAEMTIIENLQRQDLSALEQAESFRVLSEEFKLTQAQIGERIGLSRESVANYMRLLRLPESTMKLLAEGDISFATAKELLKLEDKDMIAKAATHIVEKGMTFDQVERMVWQMMGVLDPVPGLPGQEKKKGAARWVDPNVRAAQMELERLLGMRVRIRDRKGKGKIVIEYATVDDYERVVEALKGKQ